MRTAPRWRPRTSWPSAACARQRRWWRSTRHWAAAGKWRRRPSDAGRTALLFALRRCELPSRNRWQARLSSLAMTTISICRPAPALLVLGLLLGAGCAVNSAADYEELEPSLMDEEAAVAAQPGEPEAPDEPEAPEEPEEAEGEVPLAVAESAAPEVPVVPAVEELAEVVVQPARDEVIRSLVAQ